MRRWQSSLDSIRKKLCATSEFNGAAYEHEICNSGPMSRVSVALGAVPYVIAQWAPRPRIPKQICHHLARLSHRMTLQSFAFRFTTPYRIAGLAFGVTPATCGVRVGETTVVARFGPWRVQTTRDNIADVTITGAYRSLKTAGPAHLSLGDKGLTFATNGERGVCLQFEEPIAGIKPTGLIRHPSLTVTVADCDGMARALGHAHDT
jgi:hypothetical protein